MMTSQNLNLTDSSKTQKSKNLRKNYFSWNKKIIYYTLSAIKFKKIFFSGGNPFHATDLLLYTHGNYGKSLVSHVFRGYRKQPIARNGFAIH